MNDSWTVQFEELGWGAGILILKNGQVRGWDSRFLYSGTFTKTGNVLFAHQVHVQLRIQRGGSEGAHVFVYGRDKHDDIYFDLTGTIQGDKGTAIGTIACTVHQLNGTLAKQANLRPKPARA